MGAPSLIVPDGADSLTVAQSGTQHADEVFKVFSEFPHNEDLVLNKLV